MNDFSMLDRLCAYIKQSRSSFHTPGHKGRAEILDVFGEILKYDLTELPETGSLFEGAGLTMEAEKAAAKSFEAKATFFSAGGCTLAVQAMLRLALPGGGRLLCGRTIHLSAINAMALLGIEPIFMAGDESAGNYFPGRLNPDAVREMLKADNRIKALYITSPDYFGVMNDISGLSTVCGDYGIPLLVDNAHGAHLKWLGMHPLGHGAAMTADSAHKTLPVLTGGAWLHISDEKYIPRAREAMALFGSTSPSYPIMLSLDLCREWLEKEGTAAFSALAQKVAKIKAILRAAGFEMPTGYPIDPTRIAAYTPPAGINGLDLRAHLRKNGVESEFADTSHIILIPSPFNTDEDFEKLQNALMSAPKSSLTEPPTPQTPGKPYMPKAVLPPREAMNAAARTISLENSLGHVSAQNICPCPPCVPLIIMGELIDSELIARLRQNGVKSIKIIT